MDIQQRLDEILAENPSAQEYITKLWYIKEGEIPPPDTTYVLLLTSVKSPERHITVGIVATPKLTIILDVLLAMVATQG